MVAALVVGLACVVSRAQAFEPQGTAAGLKEPEMGVVIGASEMVMSPMSQITATTRVGTITITAGGQDRRQDGRSTS
jgi:hypothetical protein